MKKKIWVFLIGIGLLLLYLPSFTKYFFGDDFALIEVARHQNIFSAFNIFEKPANGFYFYRPFSIQLFWLTGWNLFGLYPLGYHVVLFSFFLLSIYLAYKLAYELFKNEKTATLTIFFYAFAASHFYRLYYLTQFQEVSFAVFTFATLIFFARKSIWTPFFFILSLTTKETAVMIVPFMLFYSLLAKKDQKFYIRLFFSCLVILTIYAGARIFIFGFEKGGYYTFDFGIKPTLNNVLWYGLWSLGLPEDFVNVRLFSFSTIINPALFSEFGSLGNISLAVFAVFITSIILPFQTLFKKFNRTHAILVGFFILFILPVMFFPFHKFPYSLAVPLFGVSALLGDAVKNLSRNKLIFICVIYLLLAIVTYQFNMKRHWTIRRADTTQSVFEYLRKNHPGKLKNSSVYFKTNKCLDRTKCPYFSEEVEFALNGDDGIRLFFNNDKIPVYYEHSDKREHLRKDSLILNSPMFVRW